MWLGLANAYAAALLAFWSRAICLGGGGSGSDFVLSVSYVPQHCSVDVVFAYVDGCRQQYGISMYGTGSPACMFEFLFYNAESQVFSQ
jgi:hypothetical protein